MGDLDQLEGLLTEAARSAGRLLMLTGAGVSAESGVPTFRGEEGYWRVGSRNYHPTELATQQAFRQQPDEVWAWYLYRRAVCRGVQPNAAHAALAKAEVALGGRFLLITQNVDGLHLRAGNSKGSTYEIHGNIDFMRCAAECGPPPTPIPREVSDQRVRGQSLSEVERRALRCGRCGGRARPHVLWFDECYDEEHFRFESSIAAAQQAAMLLVVGTSGSTNLPLQVAALVSRRAAPMVVINPEPSPFSQLAEAQPRGLFLQGTAGALVPEVLSRLADACLPS